MQALIKLQYRPSNIIKYTFFNFKQKLQTSNTLLLPKHSVNQNHHTHKKIYSTIYSSTKYHFSTISNPPTNPSQMQPQLKPISPTKSQQEKKTQQKTLEPSLDDNPFPSYDEQLIQELNKQDNARRDSEQHKLRSEKRRLKLQKIRADLKDPQNRRFRNRQRHRKQKEKLQKDLIGLKEQQVKTFLVQRKKKSLQARQKVRQAVQKQIGQPFLIDIAFEHCMNQKQNKSLAIQIQLITKVLRQIETPPNIHLCGLKEGLTKAQLVSNRFEVWPIKTYEQPIEQCLNMQKFKNKTVYYLSPDAIKTLDTIQPDTIFIIGGLVDRSVIKNASLNRARKLNIEARSLPIRPFMKQRNCLNLDHIVMIICKYMEVKDWKVAFDYGAPKRWKCAQGEKGLKQLKPQWEEDLSDLSDSSD